LSSLFRHIFHSIRCYIQRCSTSSIRSFAAVGVDPAVMGVGPAVAIPAVVKSAGLEIGDIDLFELNEVCVNCLDVHPLLSPIYL